MRAWVVALVCCALGLALGAYAAMRAQRLRQRRLAQARNARGARGERRAEVLLEANGYRVVDRQRRVSYALLVDARERAVQLVLDFVVVRDGEELVAEVKTGPTAPQLSHEGTRRQLLEYQLATGCPRVLLVDPERATIEAVCFPIVVARATSDLPQRPARVARWAWIAVAVAVACWAWSWRGQ